MHLASDLRLECLWIYHHEMLGLELDLTHNMIDGLNEEKKRIGHKIRGINKIREEIQSII